MKLYEIDKAIEELVDLETGEILNYEAFEALQMERDQKIENMALWYKNLTAEAEAIREEEKNLAERRKEAEKTAERLKGYLLIALNGKKFSTARVACSFRKSTAVEFVNEAEFIQQMESTGHTEYLKYEKPTVSKSAIKKAITEGIEVPGAALVQRNNISIK